jgi:hypothetical protein
MIVVVVVVVVVLKEELKNESRENKEIRSQSHQ